MTQHYQDNLGGWHELDDVAYEHLLTQNNPGKTFTPKTQAEYDAAHAPQPPTAQEQRDAIQAQIDTIESSTHMNRFVREAMILISQQQAAGLGLTEPQLYAANIGYRRVKDIDTQIIALRAQMDAIV